MSSCTAYPWWPGPGTPQAGVASGIGPLPLRYGDLIFLSDTYYNQYIGPDTDHPDFLANNITYAQGPYYITIDKAGSNPAASRGNVVQFGDSALFTISPLDGSDYKPITTGSCAAGKDSPAITDSTDCNASIDGVYIIQSTSDSKSGVVHYGDTFNLYNVKIQETINRKPPACRGAYALIPRIASKVIEFLAYTPYGTIPQQAKPADIPCCATASCTNGQPPCCDDAQACPTYTVGGAYCSDGSPADLDSDKCCYSCSLSITSPSCADGAPPGPTTCIGGADSCPSVSEGCKNGNQNPVCTANGQWDCNPTGSGWSRYLPAIIVVLIVLVTAFWIFS